MPTIFSYPKSHAYRQKENGKPGEGQLWNKKKKTWEEPTINEKEQMMGYRIDATKAGHVTFHQRSTRIGQAMDGNTMRWLVHSCSPLNDVFKSVVYEKSMGGDFQLNDAV